MFLTGCVTPEEAYQEVDWMVLVLLGTMIPLGIAMQNTGAAELVARYLVRLTTPLGAVGTLAAFFLFIGAGLYHARKLALASSKKSLASISTLPR